MILLIPQRRENMETSEVLVRERDEYGGSLPVENVQALASKSLKEIPARYLRPEAEFDQVSEEDAVQIPVIDLNKLLADDQHSFRHDDDELARLHLACKDWGFFQLVNHGVPEEMIEKMKLDVEEFFNLPLEKKKAYSQLPNSIEGYGQAFVVSEEQKLDWGDMLFIIPRPLFIRNMRFWPTDPPSFRENLENYLRELQQVTVRLLKLMSRNLGLDQDTLPRMFEDGTQGVRMNFYPPCVQANKAMGLTAHSDATGLTLLLQLNDVQGLQIKKNGKWVPVKPIPGAFIVNVGDVIEIMSNGKYRSIEHRAVVNSEKQRLSIATFHNVELTNMTGPLPDLLKDDIPKYKTISHGDYMRLVVSTKLDGKSLMDQMKLK